MKAGMGKDATTINWIFRRGKKLWVSWITREQMKTWSEQEIAFRRSMRDRNNE
jgi:hypothetical protein